jgi:hypothetical protein
MPVGKPHVFAAVAIALATLTVGVAPASAARTRARARTDQSQPHDRVIAHNEKLYGGKWTQFRVDDAGDDVQIMTEQGGLRGLLARNAVSRTVVNRKTGQIKEHESRPSVLRQALADQNTMTAAGIGLAAIAETLFGQPFDHTSLLYPALAVVLGNIAAKGIQRHDAAMARADAAREQAALASGHGRGHTSAP